MWNRKFGVRNLIVGLINKKMNKLGAKTAGKLVPIKGCECGCNKKEESK